MEKYMKKILLGSVVASSMLMAAGYKIPETSTNSVALSGANIAHTKGADAAYDNPANMVFMDNVNHIEANMMYLGTSATNFKGTVSGTGPHDLNAEEQDFLIPSLHYVSPKLGESGARVGVSVVVPGGLTREWKSGPAKTVSEEFTLQVVEINPTAAFRVSDKVGVAVGFRAVHTSGVVKSDGVVALGGPVTSALTRDMEGDALDFGYNLALAYKPTNELEVGVTYRSEVNLDVSGNAKLSSVPNMALVPASYDGIANVSVPLPASLNVAIAYTLPTQTTFEFVYEKTYWSSYKNLDFGYDGTIKNDVLISVFDNSIAKNWKDTEAYRIGVTQDLETLTLMAGFVLDATSVPEETLNFESPDSRSMAFSFGGRYKIDERIDVGLAGLYSMREDRTVTNKNQSGTYLNGEFSNSNVIIVSAGIGYKF
jgi:long-chain fatty acid transport protein